MREIIEYITVRKNNFESLDEVVNDLIKKGFQPFGNPYVTEDGEFFACQAMVKYKGEVNE